MQETKELLPSVSISTTVLTELLRFVGNYRAMEKAVVSETYDREIRAIADDHNFSHLCNQWRNMIRDFGRFFLNLSHDRQSRLLEYWGIYDDEVVSYREKIEKDDLASLFLPPPVKTKYAHLLVKFFYNHGIDKNPHEGVYLATVPPSKKCFGDSRNWGNYLLSLPEQEAKNVIVQILTHFKG